LAAQDAELMAAGCAKVFREKISGAKTDRPELVKAISRLEPGDVLVVTRLDRLARSTRDLLNVIAAITERGAGFKSLKDAWADTTSAHNRRGPQASEGAGRSVRTAAQDDAASAAGSLAAAGRRRDAG
jgi:DNA invertase Pin-like site-specific DNA recombinase